MVARRQWLTATVVLVGLAAGAFVAVDYRPGPSYDPVYAVDVEPVTEPVDENTTVIAYENLSATERSEFDAALDGGAMFEGQPELLDGAAGDVIAYDGSHYRVYVSTA